MQMSLEEHQLLMDVTCLWLYIRPLLKDAVSPEYMDKVDEMWDNGPLWLQSLSGTKTWCLMICCRV